jgi:hypothetical protein
MLRCLCLGLTGALLGACSQEHGPRALSGDVPFDMSPESAATEDGEEPPPLEPEASTDSASAGEITQPAEGRPDALAAPVSATSVNADQSPVPPIRVMPCAARRVGIAKESSFVCGVELGYYEDNPNYVQVFIDGGPVLFEPNDGFGWAGTSVVLHGASCNLLNDLKGHELYIELACRGGPLQ